MTGIVLVSCQESLFDLVVLPRSLVRALHIVTREVTSAFMTRAFCLFSTFQRRFPINNIKERAIPSER